MGQIMPLSEVVEKLLEFDSDYTIYALEPWSVDCSAIVASATNDGKVPESLQDVGFSYFLEIEVAQEFLEAWRRSLNVPPTATMAVQRLIDYATNDA